MYVPAAAQRPSTIARPEPRKASPQPTTQLFQTMSFDPHILIAGNPEEFHVGAHFQRAAYSLGWGVSFSDVRCAYAGSEWARALLWRCCHRPLRLARFSKEVLAACCRHKPALLLTTGLAPLRSVELAKIGALGIVRMNFLTDDPWNPVHYAGWFLES